MNKIAYYTLSVTMLTSLSFSQVNINSTTSLQNGNNNNNALTVTNQYTGQAIDRFGVRGLCLQAPNWGIGGDFQGGYVGLYSSATMSGVGARTGVQASASTGLNNGAGNTLYGVLGWAYNSSGTKIGVKGGVWNDDNTVPANQYGVLGQALGTPGAGIQSYGVYCIGNGAYTGTWTQSSDIKLKKDIKPVEKVIDKIKKISPVTYNYDLDKFPNMGFDSRKKYGLIAQNVESVFPELVRDDACPLTKLPKDGKLVKNGDTTEIVTYKGVDYIGMIPILLSAIQEQQKEIEELKNATIK